MTKVSQEDLVHCMHVIYIYIDDVHIVVLTWISIYWFSRAGPAASVRIYYEYMQTVGPERKLPKTTAPYGASFFPKELGGVPLS